MSISFAIAMLTLIAILPEYAVEAVLACGAGQSYLEASAAGHVFGAGNAITDEMERVAANITGANRLHIGLGWSAVIIIFWLKRRSNLNIKDTMELEIIMLIIATLVTFLIFFMQQVHVVVAVALIALYLVYLWISSTKEPEEPELMGPSLAIGEQSKLVRRLLVISLFIYSAIVIIVAAHPFVKAVVESGLELGIDEFILIQWIAPLASESPEIIIAVLFSPRADAIAGLTTLISAEVNKLTLLMGGLVGVFSISAGDLLNFPLNHMQSVEFLLTAAVSVLGVIFVISRVINWQAGLTLLALFMAHLPFSDSSETLFLLHSTGLRSQVRGFESRRGYQFFFNNQPGGQVFSYSAHLCTC